MLLPFCSYSVYFIFVYPLSQSEHDTNHACWLLPVSSVSKRARYKSCMLAPPCVLCLKASTIQIMLAGSSLCPLSQSEHDTNHACWLLPVSSVSKRARYKSCMLAPPCVLCLKASTIQIMHAGSSLCPLSQS